MKQLIIKTPSGNISAVINIDNITSMVPRHLGKATDIRTNDGYTVQADAPIVDVIDTIKDLQSSPGAFTRYLTEKA